MFVYDDQFNNKKNNNISMTTDTVLLSKGLRKSFKMKFSFPKIQISDMNLEICMK